MAVSVLFIGITVLLFASSSAQTCNGFVENADEFAKVEYKQQSRRGIVRQVVTSAEVFWKPNEMLDDGTEDCYELTKAELFYKPLASSEWIPSDASQRSAGAYAKWIVKDIKPCLQYEFQIKVSGNGGEAVFQLPNNLGPATEDEILDSGFIPEAPSNIMADVAANSAKLNWELSDCADRYEINYVKVGDDTYQTVSIDNANTNTMDIGNLESCTRYDVTVNALLGDEYSPDKTRNIATKPRLDVASDLDPSLVSTVNTLTLSWEAFTMVSCIDSYEITVCAVSTSECRDTEVVEKPKGLPTVTYTTDGLSPCTDYTVEIQPIFDDTEIDPKVIPFRTLSPDISLQKVESVSTQIITSGRIQVSWPRLGCAVSYNIYVKEIDHDEWAKAGETFGLELEVDNITPCTKYLFAVSATMDMLETEKTQSEVVMSDLDEDLAFEVPNLKVMNADRSASISWQHAACIQGYSVRVCAANENTDDTCVSKDTTTTEEDTIKYDISDLSPCTLYKLEVTPQIPGKTFTARINEFTTTNGVPQPPSYLEFDQLESGGKISLSWSNVECNTGYKIYKKTSEEEEDGTWSLAASPSQDIEDLIPCETYYFSVATLVDEQESARSEWTEVTIPPRIDQLPELKILNNENDNMTLRLGTGPLNQKCNVLEYELTYGIHGDSYHTVTSIPQEENTDILISFKGASGPSAVVMGRILYSVDEDEENGVWSPQVSTGIPEETKLVKEVPAVPDTTMHVIIGVIVAVALIILIGFFIVRRNRKQRNQTEKADNTKQEETQKLNDNHPEV